VKRGMQRLIREIQGYFDGVDRLPVPLEALHSVPADDRLRLTTAAGVIDPLPELAELCAHKWLAAPMGAGMFFCRHPDSVSRTRPAKPWTPTSPRSSGPAASSASRSS